MGSRITPAQIVIILTSLVLFALTAIILKRSKIGKALRAVANDQELAVAAWLDKDKITYSPTLPARRWRLLRLFSFRSIST